MKKEFILILLFGILNSVITSPQQNGIKPNSNDKPRPHIKILKQINKINDDGSYTFGYEADDGSFKVETRSKSGVVKGKYGFIDPSGQLKTVEYSAGQKSPHQESDPRIAEGTETEPKAVKADSRENNSREENSSSGENNSDGNSSSGENGSTEDPAFNSFSSQVGQKDVGPPSELSKRQGQLGGPEGSGLGSPYAGGQGQGGLGQQPYIPTTQLTGGQFRGQFVDPRFQSQGFGGGPQFGGFQSPQRPQYLNNGPQQYPIGGFGGGPQNHFVGRQYPQGFVGGSPQGAYLGGSQQPFLGGSPQQQYIGGGRGSPQFAPNSGNIQGSQFLSQSPQNQLSQQDDDGFVNGPIPQQYYNGGARPQQQFDFNGQGAGTGLGFGRPVQQGIQPNIYQSQFGGGLPLQQFGGGRPGFSQFSPSSSSASGNGGRQPYSNADISDQQQEYVPNPDIDGFSEDNDQDGFVDPYPGGNGATGSKVEAADEKTPSVKTPNGEKVQNEYTPQILGPQQGFQGGRPGLSPYNEQELQQIYNQPGVGVGAGRPQNPYPYSPQQQFSPFAYQSRQPQFQSYPIQPQQQFSPYAGVGGPGAAPGPQFVNQGNPGPFIPRGQFSPGAYQGQGFPQQGQPGFIPGQSSPTSGVPRYLNNVQASPGAQFPYDYVGGVGPQGFPLGGPQSQYIQQQGPSPGPVLSPTPGAGQGSSDSSKGNN